jgi:hypothetical protein
MAILQMTKPGRYEKSDKNKPIPQWGSVRYPMCLNCGGHCIPAFDSKKARCPSCGEVDYSMIPEDKFDEAREEIKKNKGGLQ